MPKCCLQLHVFMPCHMISSQQSPGWLCSLDIRWEKKKIKKDKTRGLVTADSATGARHRSIPTGGTFIL